MARAIRVDLLIATVALIISAGATISSVYQSQVIVRQLSASVWPYLSITSTSGPASYRLAIANDGLGPALVKSAELFVDGKRVANYREAQSRVARGVNLVKGVSSASFGAIDDTTVVRAGDSHTLIRATGPALSQVGDLGKRVSLSLCYCSLLGTCWTVVQHEPRVEVATCAPNAGIDF